MDVAILITIFVAMLVGALLGLYIGLITSKEKEKETLARKPKKAKHQKTVKREETLADTESEDIADDVDFSLESSSPLTRINRDSSYTDMLCEGDGLDTADYILGKMKGQDEKFILHPENTGGSCSQEQNKGNLDADSAPAVKENF